MSRKCLGIIPSNDKARPGQTTLYPALFLGGYGYVVRIKAATALPSPKFISVSRHSPWVDYGVFFAL